MLLSAAGAMTEHLTIEKHKAEPSPQTLNWGRMVVEPHFRSMKN